MKLCGVGAQSPSVLETIRSKLQFERIGRSCGAFVLKYLLDNGVFPAKDFVAELEEKDQGLTLSGVGAQSLSVLETIRSKLQFERTARSCGAFVLKYLLDNGVFPAKDFVAELDENCLLSTSSSPGDRQDYRMPSSA